MSKYDLGPASEIDYDCSRGFDIDGQSIFVVNKDGQYFAYRNSCPHLGVELNWNEHVFLDFDKAFIQCSTHGALFTIEDGQCVAGPCSGQALQALPLEINDGQLQVTL
jgi:nitrite reductase/ring-hydroxylating ferredoxin subunit